MPSTKPTRTTKNKAASTSILSAPRLAEIPWLVHGFSTRGGGFSKAYGKSSLNLGFTSEDSRAAVEKNRAAFLKNVGAPEWPIVEMKQVHSDVIHCVTGFVPSHEGEECGTPVLGMESTLGGRGGQSVHDAVAPSTTQRRGRDVLVTAGQRPALQSAPAGFVASLVGDGLVTDVPGILLAVKTADCMPVILADKKKKAVGIFHAGWRGTLHRIVEKGVGEMFRWFGSKPRDLQAALGPSIRDCCYKVGEEVRDHFRSQFSYADKLFREWQTYEDIHLKYPLLFLTMRAPGHSELPTQILLNLAEANRRQLMDAGVSPKNISVLPQCTASDTKTFFSHRAEHGKTGRLMSVVGIKKSGDLAIG